MTRPVRVLYDIHPRTVGGTEQFLARFLPRLARYGFEPVVVSARMDAPLRALRSRRIATVRVADMHTATGIRRLADLIRRRRIQLVQSNYYSPHLALAAGAAGVPHVWRLGGHVEYASGISKAADAAAALQMIRLLSAAVVCNSHFVRRQFPKSARRRVGVIHNGVDRVIARREKTSHGLLIGMAAHFTPQKRHDDFLRAAAIVRRTRTDVTFTVFGERYRHAGSGAYAAKIHRLAAPLVAARALTFSRFDPADRDALSACAIVVHPSVGESFSNVILEAMSAGLPVVAARSGGTPEILTRESGILVPAEDPGAIARALLWLAADPAERRRFGNAARRRARTTFSMDACVRRYVSLYRRVLRAKVQYSLPVRP